MRTFDDIIVPSPTRKMIRILVYPNITYYGSGKDISKDSFVQVLATSIAALNRLRDDLFFTVWMPEPVEVLNFSNVEQVIWPVPTHAPAMRAHFDVFRAKELLSPAHEYDLVWSHLPEATHALYATIVNLTHHRPKFFGYAHWFDLAASTTWEGDSFRENISGLLHMEHCYLNTHAQKNLVVAQARETFTASICDELLQRLVPYPPHIAPTDIVKTIASTTEKVIVFNHRPDPYKDFPAFLHAMRHLRAHRQDFTVWVPLLETSPEPWIVTDKHDKAEYYRLLRLARVGVAPKQTYAGWSVSATDGLMNGCPYIFYNADYYKELHPTADTFDNWSDALTLLHRYLDDESYRNDCAAVALTRASELSSGAPAHNLNRDITRLVQSLPVRQTAATQHLVQLIETHRRLTKRELHKSVNWGRGIAWTPYRRALMQHPNIFDTVGPEPIYQWVD